MKSSTLFDRCHINTNIENDVFVGISKKNDYYQVSFPLGYRLGSTDKELRKDILSLLHVLSIYTERRLSELEDGKRINPTDSLPVQAYLYLIKDFYENGYYKERETLYNSAKKGKIHWSRTIKTQKPVIQGTDVYYLDFIVKRNLINENELITLIHKFCVYESFDKFGWLFTSFVPSKPKVGISIKSMIAIVNDKLQNTFKDQNKILFKNMLEILKYYDENNHMNFKYGTDRFEYVWEALIDRVFGINNKEDYFPKTQWNLFTGHTHDNSVLEPDTIMLFGGNTYILDAKYYKFGWSGNPSHLPESTSINKQITYGEYVAQNEKFRLVTNDVYNVFLMPYDSKSKLFNTTEPYLCIGSANSDWKDSSKKYENVLGILVDVKHLMNVDSFSSGSEVASLAKIIENNCPV